MYQSIFVVIIIVIITVSSLPPPCTCRRSRCRSWGRWGSGHLESSIILFLVALLFRDEAGLLLGQVVLVVVIVVEGCDGTAAHGKRQAAVGVVAVVVAVVVVPAVVWRVVVVVVDALRQLLRKLQYPHQCKFLHPVSQFFTL